MAEIYNEKIYDLSTSSGKPGTRGLQVPMHTDGSNAEEIYCMRFVILKILYSSQAGREDYLTITHSHTHVRTYTHYSTFSAYLHARVSYAKAPMVCSWKT